MNADAESKRRLVEDAFGRAAPVYAKNVIFHEPGRLLVEAAQIKAGDRVLDVATARGAVLFPALERVGSGGFVHGTDIVQLSSVIPGYTS